MRHRRGPYPGRAPASHWRGIDFDRLTERVLALPAASLYRLPAPEVVLVPSTRLPDRLGVAHFSLHLIELRIWPEARVDHVVSTLVHECAHFVADSLLYLQRQPRQRAAKHGRRFQTVARRLAEELAQRRFDPAPTSCAELDARMPRLLSTMDLVTAAVHNARLAGVSRSTTTTA